MATDLDRLEAEFHRLLELDAKARNEALDALRRSAGAAFAKEVEELLAAADLPASPLDASAGIAAAGLRGAMLTEPISASSSDLDATAASQIPDYFPAIAGYRILERIGRGGSATVFLAEQERAEFSRTVALKLVDRVIDPASRRRVADEQRILARLEHPGIARLYDAGVTGAGQPFLALERVDGSPVVEHCRARALPVRARLELFLQVLDAVDYAHRAGVVHRDLKPGNILVSADGKAKLVDFGIARLVASPGEEEETRTLARAMTPAYASPEQVRGERVTTASDIYSLGVVLYELLAETLPYRVDGTRFETYADAIRAQDPDPPSTAVTRTVTTAPADPAADSLDRSRRRRELRGDLDAVVLKSLRKEAPLRYASAAEFAAELRRVLAGEAVTVRGANRRYRTARFAKRHWQALLLVPLVTALVTLAAIAKWRGHWQLLLRSPRAADELALFATVSTANEPGARALRDGAGALRRQRSADAVAGFTRATALLAGDPAEAVAWDGLARSEELRGEVGKAAGSARRAAELLRTAPASGAVAADEAERIRARGLAAERDWTRAVPAFDRLFGRLPDRLDVGLDLVAALLDSGQTAAANATLGRILQLPTQADPASRDPRLDLVEAEVAYRLGEYQRAAAAAARAAARGGESLRWRAERQHAEATARLDLRDEALVAFERLASETAAAGMAREAARARLAIGRILSNTADVERADALLEESVLALRAAGDVAGEVDALAAVAFQKSKRGDYAAALALAREAGGIARAAGDRWSESEALVAELVLFNWADDAGGVLATRDPALAALRDSENRQTLLSMLANLALDAIERRELARAQSHLDEAEGLLGKVGARFADAALDRARAYLEETRGATDRARELYGRALDKARRAAIPVSIASHLSDLAWLEVAADRPDAAESRAREAIAALEELGKRSDAAELEGIFAWVAARRGDRAGAYGRLAEVRTALGEDASAPSFSSMVLEARIAEALGDWRQAIGLRRRAIRMAEERALAGPLLDQQYALARALHAAGERRELERLASELLPEAERLGLRGIADGLRGLLAASARVEARL